MSVSARRTKRISAVSRRIASIVRDDPIRSGEPRVEGTRIAVRDIKRRVIDAGEDPHVVAGEYEISMADLFGALAHYYEHRDAFESDDREAERRRRDGERRTRAFVDERRGENSGSTEDVA
ncbi:DUF433 domain-containing protein [Halorubrum ezzemoulense]|uniref:DUF433 domain-containing protein n=1 Tax=Halorubrum ezzemoulense TaxID=337243 RepID=UPI00211AE6F9|nr:DUF433 domain-containing protein [Halorubrum ezzemoulense]